MFSKLLLGAGFLLSGGLLKLAYDDHKKINEDERKLENGSIQEIQLDREICITQLRSIHDHNFNDDFDINKYSPLLQTYYKTMPYIGKSHCLNMNPYFFTYFHNDKMGTMVSVTDEITNDEQFQYTYRNYIFDKNETLYIHKNMISNDLTLLIEKVMEPKKHTNNVMTTVGLLGLTTSAYFLFSKK
jgi:hypothetical protein